MIYVVVGRVCVGRGEKVREGRVATPHPRKKTNSDDG